MAGVLWAGMAAAEPAKVRTAGPLLSQPLATAKASGTLKAGAAVDIVARKGFWAQVKAGPATGWLKLDRLTLSAGNQVTALASGRTGSGNIVSASGGRGLDASGLASATPNMAAVAALSSSAASEDAAIKFAAAGKLQSRTIPYLRAPR